MLAELGCDVATAADAEEALEILADRPVEVLITDVGMPGMDGYELAHAALKMNEQLKVIVVTGGDTDGHGFPFVRKPFSQEDLKRTMANTGLC
jgi:CheY-like chemotaxis protein